MRKNARRIIETLPKGARGAEIGTHKGQWTRALQEIAKPRELTLIDPWGEDAARDARPHAHTASQIDRDAQYADALETFRDAVILRQPSTLALAAMGDATLDWVFLDGDKQYDTILADLEHAVRVVRPGGVIAGGGWHFGVEMGRPVREAVGDIQARLAGAALLHEGQFWALTLPDTVILAPRPTDERFLIISTMKNESPYILEWIAHHRAIGFTDFLVFTNDCDDTTDPLLDRLQERGILTHQVNTVLRRGPHKSALKWARDHVLRHKATWTLIADVDEFIDLPPDGPSDGTIQGLMRALGPETDVVSFPWKCFGNGGVEGFVDKPITAQFTSCEAAPKKGGRKMRDVKTMFRKPEAVYHFGLHRPRIHPEWVDRIVWKSPSGADISPKMNPSKTWVMPWDGCQGTGHMHHYPLRSLEAYVLKKNRGRANHIGEDLGLEYWDKWNLSGGRDTHLKNGAPGFAKALAELRADRKTRQLHKQGVAWHRAQFQQLMEQPRYRALWDELRARDGSAAPVAPAPTGKRDAVRRQMLQSLPQGGVGAEIGVWEGRFSEVILDVCAPTILHLIDPWEYDPTFNKAAFGRKKNAARMPEMHDMVAEKFADDPRVRVHRAPSSQALQAFDDDALDWIYIDGNHHASFVAQDLDLATRKVRPGGVIAGDDYHWRDGDAQPVRDAVARAMAQLGDAATLKVMGQQYLITLAG